MLRWLKKKVRKTRPSKVKKMPDITNVDYSLHIYEEINNEVFVPQHIRTSSLPMASRKGYPLFKPDHLTRDPLYSIAQIPGIDSPRPPSTSTSRRKLSFDVDKKKGKGNAQSWSAARGVVPPCSDFSDDSDTENDDDYFEFDLGSSSDIFPHTKSTSVGLALSRKGSVTRSETGLDYRKVKLERDSSLRSSASKTSEASSGFFSEDPDSDSLRMSSIRRKYRIQSTNRTQPHSTFIRYPSVNSRPKHHKVNECATPSYHKPSHTPRGHFRRQQLTVPTEPHCNSVYLSPIKIVLPEDEMAPLRSTIPRKVNKRLSEGQAREYTPVRSSTQRHAVGSSNRYGVGEVFSSYEIPDFCGRTSNLPVNVPKQRTAHRNVDDQPVFWKRDNNRLLQDVIRSNYERQMCIFV